MIKRGLITTVMKTCLFLPPNENIFSTRRTTLKNTRWQDVKSISPTLFYLPAVSRIGTQKVSLKFSLRNELFPIRQLGGGKK